MERPGNRLANDQSDLVLGLPRWTADGRNLRAGGPGARSAGDRAAAPGRGGSPASRPGLRRFLYVDTVLPMLAVLIVLVILLAWVG